MLLRALALADGDWVEVDKLCSKFTFQQQKGFLYAAYREQLIELIEAQEYQKAFTHLTKRLKPLEGSAASRGEFKDLCYLLTCRSVHEVLPNWEGATAAREALVTHFATMLELEERWQEGSDDLYNLPERRLIKLLEQAAAYQVGRSSNGHRAAAAAPAAAAACANGSQTAASAGGASGAKAGEASNGKGGRDALRTEEQVTSLLHDYASPCVPNTPHLVLRGHSDGVKSVAWLRDSALLFSAGNDQTLRLWSTRDGACLAMLDGHAARIWQLAVSHLSPLVASAAADGTVRLWRVGDVGGGVGGGAADERKGGGVSEPGVSRAVTCSSFRTKPKHELGLGALTAIFSSPHQPSRRLPDWPTGRLPG